MISTRQDETSVNKPMLPNLLSRTEITEKNIPFPVSSHNPALGASQIRQQDVGAEKRQKTWKSDQKNFNTPALFPPLF